MSAIWCTDWSCTDWSCSAPLVEADLLRAIAAVANEPSAAPCTHAVFPRQLARLRSGEAGCFCGLCSAWLDARRVAC